LIFTIILVPFFQQIANKLVNSNIKYSF